MPKLKNSNATFWVIFKHCVRSKKLLFFFLVLMSTIILTQIDRSRHRPGWFFSFGFLSRQFEALLLRRETRAKSSSMKRGNGWRWIMVLHCCSSSSQIVVVKAPYRPKVASIPVEANQFYGLKLAFATWFGGMALLSHSRERNWLWVLVVVVGWFTVDFIPYFLLLLMDISWENSMRYTVGKI